MLPKVVVGRLVPLLRCGDQPVGEAEEPAAAAKELARLLNEEAKVI